MLQTRTVTGTLSLAHSVLSYVRRLSDGREYLIIIIIIFLFPQVVIGLQLDVLCWWIWRCAASHLRLSHCRAAVRLVPVPCPRADRVDPQPEPDR